MLDVRKIMVKLSIIVPVYNVKKYLRKCVDSLLAQDLPASDYEIILVDDGSTDGSATVCDEYAMSHNTSDITHNTCVIRVLHQHNAGVGAARNAGIAIAEGEYMMFVDSDDFIESNVLGTLMEQVECEQLDVLRFDYRNVRLTAESGKRKAESVKYEEFEPNKYPHPVDMRTDIVSGERYLEERMGYACYAVMYVIRRNLIIRNQNSEVSIQIDQPNIKHQTSNIENILFTEGIHYEDTEWLPRMMLAAKRVNSTPLMVYNYFLHEGSITQVQGQLEKVKQNLEDCITVIGHYNDYIAQSSNSLWFRNMRSLMVVSVLTNTAQYVYSERTKFIERLRSLDVFPLTIANQGATYIRKARVINFSPLLLVELMHIKSTILKFNRYL